MLQQAVEIKISNPNESTDDVTVTAESHDDLPDADLSSVGVLPTIAIPDENGSSSSPVILLPSLSKNPVAVPEHSYAPSGSIILPAITKTFPDPTQEGSNTAELPTSHTDILTPNTDDAPDVTSCTSQVTKRLDPYSLLEEVNPELLQGMSVEQLNTRKWILGALASNALAGRPIKDYLTEYCSRYKDYTDWTYSDYVARALNNLDCWERIERTRATSGVSYGGKRADEISNAGGWGGLGGCSLLPTYHHYMASISGDLLEAHLEPVKDTRYIVKYYLSDPHKLGMTEEMMKIFRENLGSQKVDDSWFALLQEHNLKQLKDCIMRYFVWEDERLLLNCAPSKEKCQGRGDLESKSLSSIQHEAFDPAMERDLTNQYIFSPRSDEVR